MGKNVKIINVKDNNNRFKKNSNYEKRF